MKSPEIIFQDFLDGAAVEAGLRQNDEIETLNGNDVHFSSAEVVAAMIKY